VPICGSQEMPLCLSTSQSLKMLLDNIKLSKYTPLYTHIFWFEMTIIFMCKYQYLYRIFSIDAYKRVSKDNALYMHVFRSQKRPSVYAIVRISKYAYYIPSYYGLQGNPYSYACFWDSKRLSVYACIRVCRDDPLYMPISEFWKIPIAVWLYFVDT